MSIPHSDRPVKNNLPDFQPLDADALQPADVDDVDDQEDPVDDDADDPADDDADDPVDDDSQPEPPPAGKVTLDLSTSPATTEARTIEAFALLPSDCYLNQKMVAEILGVTPRAVRRMVKVGELPPPLPLGTQRLWAAGSITAHWDQRQQVLNHSAEIELEKRNSKRKARRSYGPWGGGK